MHFGVGLATGMESCMYPVPFGNAGTLLRISQAAERLGYHHVGGNDHLTTQHYVAAEWPQPPNYCNIFVAFGLPNCHPPHGSSCKRPWPCSPCANPWCWPNKPPLSICCTAAV